MELQNNQPDLRLISAPDASARFARPAARATSAALRQTRNPAPHSLLLSQRILADAIADENRSAALSALDARWALAVRTAASLQGGKAALLPPPRRREIMTLAQTLALRPFDAQLIIAIVQDSARRGEDPLSRAVRERLMLVEQPKPAPAEDATPFYLALSMFLGALGMLAMIRFFAM